MNYINKKNKVIELDVSHHAFLRFKQRYHNITKKHLSDKLANELIEKYFSISNRMKQNKKLKARNYKYGNDTIYFKCPFFTFVVQDKTIVTIEISDRYLRNLN